MANAKKLLEETHGNMTLITYRQRGYMMSKVINNQTGGIVIAPRQTIGALKLTEKLFGFYFDGQYSFYNENGRFLKDYPFVQCDKKNKVILVFEKGVYYYVDFELNKISRSFKHITPFDCFGYSAVRVDEEHVSMLTTDMELLFTPVKGYKIHSLSEEYFKVMDSWAQIVNKEGEYIITGPCDDISLISGYFKTKYSCRYGLKDKNNKVIFENSYNEIIERDDRFIAVDYRTINQSPQKEYMK